MEKTRTIIPTTRQRKTIKGIMAGKSVSRAMREAGYDDTTAKNPKNLTESKGFELLCIDNGLTDDFLIKSLVSDIKKKPGKREKELRLAFQVRGKLKGDDPGGNTFNFNFLTVEQQKRVAGRLQARDTESAGEPDRLLDSDEPKV